MRYTFIKQHDSTDCAAACLAMICLHYKKETTITRLRDIMGTDLKGTNLLGLSKCANNLGFTSQAVRVDSKSLDSKFTLPAIAHINTEYGMSHFIVIFKITKKYLIVGDPAKDLIKMSRVDFETMFTGALLVLAPNNAFTLTKESNIKVFERFAKLLLPQKKLMFYAILSSLIMTMLGIISSLFNNVFYDEILPYNQKDLLRTVMFVFIGVSIIQIMVSFIREWIMMFLSFRIDIPLLLGYFNHIYHLPMKFFSTRKTGDITTRFSDAFIIKNIFTNIAMTLVMDIAMAIFTGIALFNMNSKLFGIIVVMTVVSIILVFIFKQPYKKINEEQMQQSSIMNAEIIEGLRAVETIKSNAIEDIELEKIEKEYIKSLKIGYKEGILSSCQGVISSIISTTGNMFLTYVSLMAVMNGNITLGSMMSFMTLSSFFMNPVSRLVQLQLSIQEVNISMKRITEILDYETEQQNDNDLMELDKVIGDIEFRNVTFRYGTRNPILNGITFSIPRGKKVAIVGSSGSGKSTIAKLLLKYYEIEDGNILINGTDIKEYTSDSIRKSVSYVPQNIELFSKNIFENIRISNMSASFEDVKEAAQKADAHDFITKLPMQYYTMLEEAGNGLSGGEKQRIALARAFVKKNNGLFILDESTSNLDFATENIVFNMIYKDFRDISMLIIAHRLATVKKCDIIIVLDKGNIVEQGTHEELLNLKGKYYDLWNMQQGNF